MGIVWNREVKRLVMTFGAVFVSALFAVNVCVGFYSDNVRKEYNELLAAVFGNIARAYPLVAEEELVSVLNGKGNEDAGVALLEKYGVYQAYGGKTFAAQEQGLFYLRLCCNVLLVLLCLVFTVALLWYLRGRQHKISELTYYMESLNRHEYKLDLDDNGEDELSGLRNEIYKFLVMLREQADRAVERRRVLADSMADISHQLKTPLTSITVLIDNLSEEPDMEPDVRRRFMSELTYQTAGMSWLVTTMLKTSRLDAGVVELVRERIPVKTLAEDVAQRLEIAAEWKQAVFSVDAAEDAMLYADEKWTAEALMNIVKNAIEHSPQGGRIEITGEENDIYTQIAVRDHGEGITQEEQRKLFQRFYNGGSVREDSMGIGLALAKKIVEKQNGFIAVQSRRGEGTVITLRFLKN